jgi:hypothetical protein
MLTAINRLGDPTAIRIANFSRGFAFWIAKAAPARNHAIGKHSACAQDACFPIELTKERTAQVIRPISLLAFLSAGALAACVETVEPTPMPAVTGGNLSSVAANACRAAIASQAGRPISDVAVFDVAESEAGVGVMATVAGAEAPWACQSSPSGQVAGVTYTGSEGAL